MRKSLKNFVLLLLLCAMSFGQSLSAADRQKGVEYLEKTRDGVVSATQGLSEDQWKFKPAPDRWSVAETLEHIALVEDYIFHKITTEVMKAGPGTADRDTSKTDAMVLAMLPDRSHKAKAPPELMPTGRWTPQESLDHFLKSREKTIAFLQSTSGLREHVTDSPIGQKLDAYEWLLYMGGHSERHTKQILEVKAGANFTKN